MPNCIFSVSASGSIAVTPEGDTAAVKSFVAILATYSATPTLTDSKNNVWNYGTQRTSGALHSVRMAWCNNPIVGSSHTFTMPTGAPALAVLGFDEPFDAFDAETGQNSATQAGSITPDIAGQLFVTGIVIDADSEVATINSGFTLEEQQPHVSPTHVGVAAAYKIQPAIAQGAENPTWGGVGSVPVAMMSFKFIAPLAPKQWQRQLSPFILNFFQERAVLNARSYNTELAVEITLNDDTKVLIATANLTMDSVSKDGASEAITPLTFIGKISGAPDIRQSQTKTPDAGNFELVNLDGLFNQSIVDSSRIFDNAKVRLYWVFPKPVGNYEGIIYFDGYFNELSGDNENASMSITADASSRASVVGIEATQRCMNELGDDRCGVDHLPAGATCSKLWSDKVNGCKFWGGGR